jgi:hypothetical protein
MLAVKSSNEWYRNIKGDTKASHKQSILKKTGNSAILKKKIII